MILRKYVSVCVLLSSAVIIPVLFAQAEKEKPKPARASTPTRFMVALNQVKWTAAPDGMVRGTPSVEAGSPLRYALMEGDPMKPDLELKLGSDRFVAK